MARGGHRHGAGRPKGSRSKGFVAKEAAREALRLRLTAEIDTFADALVSRARGVRYFITRNKKTGKYELVTNPDQVVRALNAENDESGEFYTDKPDVQAIREAFDRMVDRAPNPPEEVHVDGELIVRWES